MLADLAGKPLLWHVVNRLKQCKTLHNVIVSTPDEELAKLAYEWGAWGYPDTGDPNNVLLRYIKTAGWSGAQIVVRITGDCPLLSPELVDNCVNAYLDNRVDIVSNVVRRSYPKGLDVEVLHTNTLKRIYHLTQDPRYLEHVTLFAYENPQLFVFKSISQNNDYSRHNVSVDTQRDLDRVSNIMHTLKESANMLDLMEELEKNG